MIYQAIRTVFVHMFPLRYFATTPKHRKPIGPLSVLMISLCFELAAIVAIAATFYSYFASQKTVQTTISGTIIEGQTCVALIPRNGIISLSSKTSENAQFAQANYKNEQCMSVLQKNRVCAPENRFDVISLLGVINPNNSRYHASGAFSFTPTTTTGLSTTFGPIYGSSTSFPIPMLTMPQTFSTSNLPLYHIDLRTISVTSSYGYNPAHLLEDFQTGTLYDTGRAFSSSPPAGTVQLPIHSVGLEAEIGYFKLVDLAIHDGVYYGIATEPLFNQPTNLAVDSDGNVYVADNGNNLVRKSEPKSGVTIPLVSTTGTSANPSFNRPWGVALDSRKNVYVADRLNACVRRIDVLTGDVTQIGKVSGLHTSSPVAVAVDSALNVYVADCPYPNPCSVRMIDQVTGNVSTIGSSASPPFSNGIADLAVDRDGNVYVTDAYNNLVRMIDHVTGAVINIGNGANPPFIRPSGITVGNDGNIYVADSGNNLLRRITGNSTSSVVTLLDGTTTTPPFQAMYGVDVDSQDNVYIADYYANIIRKMDASSKKVVRMNILMSPPIIEWNISQPLASYLQWPSNYQHYSNSYSLFFDWGYLSNINISFIDRDYLCQDVYTFNGQCLILRKATYNLEENKIHVIFNADQVASSISRVAGSNFVITLDPKARDNWQMNTACEWDIQSSNLWSWDGDIFQTPNGTNLYSLVKGPPVTKLYVNYSDTQITNWEPNKLGTQDISWNVYPSIQNFNNLLESATSMQSSRMPISGIPTNYMLMYLTLNSGFNQMVTYDTFNDTYFSNGGPASTTTYVNDAPGATTTYMIAYTYGVCNGNVTRYLLETGLNQEYSKSCLSGQGLYYQSPNVYYGIPLGCLNIPYERLLTDCPEIRANIESLVNETCEASFEKVCERLYDLNPPFSCTLDIYSSLLTVISLSISNSLALFGIFSFIMGVLMKQWFGYYKPSDQEKEVLASSLSKGLDDVTIDFFRALVGKPPTTISGDDSSYYSKEQTDSKILNPVHIIEMSSVEGKICDNTTKTLEVLDILRNELREEIRLEFLKREEVIKNGLQLKFDSEREAIQQELSEFIERLRK